MLSFRKVFSEARIEHMGIDSGNFDMLANEKVDEQKVRPKGGHSTWRNRFGDSVPFRSSCLRGKCFH